MLEVQLACMLLLIHWLGQLAVYAAAPLDWDCNAAPVTSIRSALAYMLCTPQLLAELDDQITADATSHKGHSFCNLAVCNKADASIAAYCHADCTCQHLLASFQHLIIVHTGNALQYIQLEPERLSTGWSLWPADIYRFHLLIT